LNENQSYFLIDVVIVVGYAAIVVVVAIAQKGVSIFFYLKFFFLLRWDEEDEYLGLGIKMWWIWWFGHVMSPLNCHINNL
jgi:hypothetical protein